jgi:hypothetical protein
MGIDSVLLAQGDVGVRYDLMLVVLVSIRWLSGANSLFKNKSDIPVPK